MEGATLDRLAKLCARLDSPYQGEVGATVNQITKLLRDNNLQWRDIIAVHPKVETPVFVHENSMTTLLQEALSHSEFLAPSERDLLRNMLETSERGGSPTQEQLDWFDAIRVRLGI
jgi:hypothetical protein